MRHQEASTVIDASQASVEARLAEIEAWPTFLVGVESVERLGHERYRFVLVDGRDRREAVVCVRHLAADHSFRWRALEGPSFSGRLDLRAVDDRHTAVHLAFTNHPGSFLAGVAEMVMPRRSRAELDLGRLEELLHA